MKLWKTFIILMLLSFICCWAQKNGLKIQSQKSGPWQTNSYLLYDKNSGEAAIVDPGMAVDRILAGIKDKNLKLKYILLTHCHQDHLSGVPQVSAKFPEARLCMSKKEFDNLKLYSLWQKIYPAKDVEQWQKIPEIVTLMNFDYNLVRKPDIFIQENSKLSLGDMDLRAINIPGHSNGSVGYFINKCLFSGDLIYFNSVGYINYRLGSKEEIVKSVQKLYNIFPDNTIIYPGHGPSSTIGQEKKSNNVVSAEAPKEDKR